MIAAYCLERISRLLCREGRHTQNQEVLLRSETKFRVWGVGGWKRLPFCRAEYSRVKSCTESSGELPLKLPMSHQLYVDLYIPAGNLLEARERTGEEQQNNPQSSHGAGSSSCYHQSVWKGLLTPQALNRVHSNETKLTLDQQLFWTA